MGGRCPGKTPCPHPQPRPGAPLPPAPPRARARRVGKSRPSDGPSFGKVSTTFPGAAGRALGPRAPRPSRVVTRRPSSASVGLPRRRPFTCARCGPSVRAGSPRRPAPRPAPPPAARPLARAPQRHHAFALQEEKQRQIQPQGADPEVRRRPHAAPTRPRRTARCGAGS